MCGFVEEVTEEAHECPPSVGQDVTDDEDEELLRAIQLSLALANPKEPNEQEEIFRRLLFIIFVV